MLNHAYKDLYNQDSVHKNVLIEFDGGSIKNTELYSEGIEILERLCSESELRFGSCESSVLKIKVANVVEQLKGKWITVSETLGTDTDNPFLFGKYKVVSDVPSGNRNYREITAYDALYDVLNTDVAAWYESLKFPISQKAFRNSFFNYFGLEQKETVLIHDALIIEKTIEANSISGKDVITSLCELNGVFGHINRSGKFEYISLDKDDDYIPIEINKSLYKSCEYEDFVTQNISKLLIRQEADDVGTSYGDGENCYIIENNFLVYGKTTEEMNAICKKLFEKISKVSYRPFNAVIRGNPCYMVGDSLNIETRYKTVSSYILERRLTGLQALFDDIQAQGVFEYDEDVNSLQKDVFRLKGKTNILQRDIERTRSEIKDVESGLRTEIEQTASRFAVEVIGSVNLLRNYMTLDFPDYYFETQTGDILLDENGAMIIDENGYVLVG